LFRYFWINRLKLVEIHVLEVAIIPGSHKIDNLFKK
jgi:hypothetical protein